MLSPAVVASADNQGPIVPGIFPARSQEQALFTLNDQLEPVDQQQLTHVLRRTEIHGTPFNGRTLEIADLVRLGMEPNYQVSVGNRSIYLAGQLYLLAHGRVAIVAYVQDESSRLGSSDVYTVRSFYRSHSQGGSWRLLPEVLAFGERIAWYSKGFDENSLSLPSSLLEAIQQVRIRGGIARGISSSDRSLLLAGSVRSTHERGAQPYDGEGGTYTSIMPSQGVRLNDDTCTSAFDGGGEITEPHKVRISNPANAPDLTVCLRSFAVESPINSNGLPDQVLCRRNRYDTEPDLLSVERVEGAGGSIGIQIPGSCSLYFTEEKNGGFAFTGITAPDGSRHDVSPWTVSESTVERELPGMTLSLDEFGRPVLLKFASGIVVEPLFGLMTARCFESQGDRGQGSGKLEYLFLTDSERRSMLGAVVELGPINQLGLHTSWVRSRSLMMPLYEYQEMSGGFGDWQDRRIGYTCMWPYFLSQVGLIRDFHQRYIGGDLPGSPGVLSRDDSADFSQGISGAPNGNDRNSVEAFLDIEFEAGLAIIEETCAVSASAREVGDRQVFMLGTVPFTATLEENGDLVLEARDHSHTYRYAFAYLQRHGGIDIGRSGGTLQVDDASLAPVHARLACTVKSETDGVRKGTISLTPRARGMTSVEGELVDVGMGVPLLQRHIAEKDIPGQ